ncbi:uncharacterized protein N7459_009459 [Penicillium hispanicum]|uniref:uncharacterized protein n=1 Tax=Penicillium hispanicum TaxID=1080232 RepID=UPI0025400C32|nr:uncharacterized protein N7459_009459 [Penicillium hispanicum]KAJ5570029.1 hypothetical protein N7459_009459 [Penicillium hispanicum]
MRDASTLLALLIFPVLITIHLLVAPYTKVEESFHVQAIHDILVHGFPDKLNLNQSHYDHFEFPGAVPRTATGAAVLAKLSQPVIALSEGIDPQILARGILGLYNALTLAVFAYGLRRSFGQTVATWYILFQSSQFHLIYYASRPLSNMFAFGLTTLAMRYLLPDALLANRRQSRGGLSLLLLTFAGVVFRSELALLVGTQTLFLLATRQIELVRGAIVAGLAGLATGLLATVLVDSQFWQRYPLWPELDAFLFNVVSGQSSAWGTDPWYFYFLNALPRLLLNPLTYLLAIPVALRQPATRSAAIPLLVPSLAFIALYSFQPHKEWRFIIYTIPPVTAAAALGASYLWTRRSRSLFSWAASRILVLSTLAAFLLSNAALLPASAANYPGAHALNTLHQHHDQSTAMSNLHTQPGSVAVYLGNLACQTGVTRFLQQPATSGWRYDKTEDEKVKDTDAFWSQFDYVLVEASADPEYQDADETRLRSALPGSKWDVAEVVDGFAGISIVRPGSPAAGTAERRILSMFGGDRAVGVYESLRDSVRKAVLRGWWVELKMQPKIKVLKRVRE